MLAIERAACYKRWAVQGAGETKSPALGRGYVMQTALLIIQAGTVCLSLFNLIVMVSVWRRVRASRE